ncbi:MAG TPA: transposase [Thermoanaerobaculia bacterium]|jgi:REP element-mobilizing transposase RayT
MARKLRYVPENRTLISITNRTVQGRYLLRPGPTFNDIFLGILGRAQRVHEIRLFAVSVMSNHFHVLLAAENAEKIANCMRDLQSKLAREVNRLTGWRGPVFERRYEMTVVTDEEAAQVERLRYVLSQGVKENLVEQVRDWPGVHSAAALLDGVPLKGHWFDRTREYAARNQREEFGRLRFASEELVVLSPLPYWAHLTAAAYRNRVKVLVEDIEAEVRRVRESSGATVLGVVAILSQDPQHRPASVACSPAPLVHAATKAARRFFYGTSFFPRRGPHPARPEAGRPAAPEPAKTPARPSRVLS